MSSTKEKKEVDLIFTRDFSLFTCQFWRDQLLLKGLEEVWGISLSDQIINYTGRAIESYRAHQEIVEMKNYIVHLPLTHHLFSKIFREKFRKAASELRKIITSKPKAEDFSKIFHKSLKYWSEMYPGYMLANFLPGAWADEFKKTHGKLAEEYLEAQFKNRLFVEGLFEAADLFIRSLVAKKLEEENISGAYANLLTFNEVEKFFGKNQIPELKLLKERKKGYIVINGKLLVGKSLPKTLEKYGYHYKFPKTEGIEEFEGNIAYKAEPVKGKVKLVFNQEDAALFPEGAILVAAMTIPDYLPAMKRACALVTDEGGITCHAAIIARELKKPCIISTKIATRVLKDGDLVEVDANKGIVKVLEKA
jgi:phosphohistidine swiveling domain-containing protein